MLAEHIMDDCMARLSRQGVGRTGTAVCVRPTEFLGVMARMLLGATFLTFLWKTLRKLS